MHQALLLVVAIAAIYVSRYYSPLLAALGFAIIGFLASDALIPRVSQSFIKIGCFGKDLSKPGRPVIPESIGAISATVYLFIMFFYIPFLFYKYLVVITPGGGHRDASIMQSPVSDEYRFPHGKMSEYLSAVLCLQSTVLLGIADDLFDLRWRHKFFLPAVAAIPLLVVYYVDFGVTHVLIPDVIQRWLGTSKTIFNLGALYYVYMASMAIFCPNSINILAGVNGLEVGQSIVLGVIFLINDSLYLLLGNEASKEAHLFSAILIIPFLGVAFSLWKWNKWPAKVFVGDTFCYFAGMIFSVVGILGHFSKTTLIFFIPQTFNFAYSCPQLFGLVPCPRHRMPRFNEADGLLYPSRANLVEKPPKKVFVPVLKLLSSLKLIDLEVDPQTGALKSCSNMTLINLVLVWFGPTREDKLCNRILAIQFTVGLCAIVARHSIGSIIFGHDNIQFL
ncbi:GlcNAc-1-P transferase [Lachancea thermotolerans]|uniref:UDP-N-acetylglucosamine--dolichyl-phosphate N-acetylglucosaminephosphotransferase n=1 Tax=Lachancea thermotolerans (strain ATCC 56472 / CBS 6340 / NRRL Y-8284) TaxID=559295 RepID=C5E2K1_LACTC|nr:KLTH0H05632p [Lachancea thermotolerans CBS 6340]CAR30262.1 KLTH0H05632p [Lachancea thermotolerans CBS 6340]